LTPLTKKSDLKVEYLVEFKSIYVTALTGVSGAQIKWFDLKKKPEVENLVTGSLQVAISYAFGLVASQSLKLLGYRNGFYSKKGVWELINQSN
jgi:hypothetical protein